MAPENCARCDAPLSGTEKACPQCGRPLSGAKLAGAPVKAANCPICKLPLYTASVSGQGMLHCAECKGLAIGRDSLMKLQPFGPKQIELSAEEQGYKRPHFFEPRKRPPFLICPFCSKRMAGSKLGPLQVDICGDCDGLWLDAVKAKGLEELIGPYKWRMTKKK